MHAECSCWQQQNCVGHEEGRQEEWWQEGLTTMIGTECVAKQDVEGSSTSHRFFSRRSFRLNLQKMHRCKLFSASKHSTMPRSMHGTTIACMLESWCEGQWRHGMPPRLKLHITKFLHRALRECDTWERIFGNMHTQNSAPVPFINGRFCS